MPYKDPAKQKAAQRASLERTYDVYMQRNGKYKQQMREWLDTLKLSIGCQRCKEREPWCLEFHHRNTADKDWCISAMLYRFGKDTILTEIAKCDLLCANCHRKEEKRLHTERKQS